MQTSKWWGVLLSAGLFFGMSFWAHVEVLRLRWEIWLSVVLIFGGWQLILLLILPNLPFQKQMNILWGERKVKTLIRELSMARENEIVELFAHLKKLGYLTNGTLVGCDLSEAQLSHIDLSQANLKKSNLEGSNLTGGILDHANLVGANLRWCNLTGANLKEAKLAYARLRGANLHNSNLQSADLSRAYLYDVNIRGADLRGANLRGANFNNVQIDTTTRLPNGEFYALQPDWFREYIE